MAQSNASADHFKKTVEQFNVSSFRDEAERKKAIEAARSLVHRLERPMDSMLRIGWIEPAHALAIKTAVDMKLFDALGKDGAQSKKSVDELASATKSDPLLVQRLVRLLAAMDTIKEVGERQFAPNGLSLALMERPVSAAIDFRWNITQPSFQVFPRFLQQTDYQNPTNARDCAFQLAMQTKLAHFDWVYQHPSEMSDFSEHMVGYTSQRGTWDQIYPVQDLLLTPAPATDDIFLVDVGGSHGHDLTRFAATFFPNDSTPRLVLQDLPSVISQASAKGALPPSIRAMGHDFFTPQPIKGARAYYLHSVCHDWTDADAVKILEAMHAAASTRTSSGQMPKVLLNENVLPPMGAKAQAASLDLMMSAYQAGCERSEGQWKALLEKAGYKVTNVYQGAAVDEGIVEAEAV